MAYPCSSLSYSSDAVTNGPFFTAAINGDLRLLKKTVTELKDGGEGSFADIRDCNKCTALHRAAGAGHTHICEYLIEKLKFNVNDEDKNGLIALHMAVLLNHRETALYLLKNGANIAKTDIAGCTPLHSATCMGGKDLLQLLISRGSDIEAKADGGTPLTHAALNGNPEAVEFLLQNKANPNPINSCTNPIILSSQVSLACTDLLVKAGADPNTNICTETPLHNAVEGSKLEIITYLLKKGANPDTVNYMGLTPLELAAFNEDMKAMEILFPVTTKKPSIPDWSINGIRKYIKSEEATKKMELIAEQTFSMAKLKGEEAFKRKDYWVAINWYSMANGLDLTDATVLSNKSLCYARLNRGFTALSYAKECVKLRPNWAKAHYREGVALNLLKEYSSAAKSFSNALKLDPNNLEIQKALREAMESEIASMSM